MPVIIAGALIIQQIDEYIRPSLTDNHKFSVSVITISIIVNVNGKSEIISKMILLAFVRFDWKTERKPIRPPATPEQTIMDIRKIEQI